MNRLEFLKRLVGSIAGLVVGTKLARAAAPIELPKIVADPAVEVSGIRQMLLREQGETAEKQLADEFFEHFMVNRGGYDSVRRAMRDEVMYGFHGSIVLDEQSMMVKYVPRGTKL